MSTKDRARQFMPFSALKGLEEALAEKEKIVVSKIEPSEGSVTDKTRHEIFRDRF